MDKENSLYDVESGVLIPEHVAYFLNMHVFNPISFTKLQFQIFKRFCECLKIDPSLCSDVHNLIQTHPDYNNYTLVRSIISKSESYLFESDLKNFGVKNFEPRADEEKNEENKKIFLSEKPPQMLESGKKINFLGKRPASFNNFDGFEDKFGGEIGGKIGGEIRIFDEAVDQNKEKKLPPKKIGRKHFLGSSGYYSSAKPSISEEIPNAIFAVFRLVNRTRSKARFRISFGDILGGSERYKEQLNAFYEMALGEIENSGVGVMRNEQLLPLVNQYLKKKNFRTLERCPTASLAKKWAAAFLLVICDKIPNHSDEIGLVSFQNTVLITRREKLTYPSRTRINFVCDCTKKDHEYEKKRNLISVDAGEMCVYKYFTRYLKRLSGYGSKCPKFAELESSGKNPKKDVDSSLLAAFGNNAKDIKVGFELLGGASSVETEHPIFSVSTMKSHIVHK